MAAGDALLVLEAMKMQHQIPARAAGTVEAIQFTAGTQVEAGALLVEVRIDG